MILTYLLIALGFNLALFIPAYFLKTDKLTDVSYALTFILLISLAFTKEKILLFALILFWALRLGTFLLIRIHHMKKDERFNKTRNSFIKFLLFWIFQGAVVWILLLPYFLATTKLFLPGITIWIAGILIETIADYQKFSFKKKNPKKLMQKGLWKYSRHPNYFGEILCWIGVYVTALPAIEGILKLIGLLSPLAIYIILRYVSGIPLLEKSAEKYGKDYETYKKKTNLLILGPRH